MEKKLSATCDGDESIARGCALQCAMLAPFIKVRDFEVNDITPYGIQLNWQSFSPDDKKTLEELWSEEDANSPLPVPALSSVPCKKIISFKDKTEPFQVIARYADAKLPADTIPFLGRWVISEVPPAIHSTNESKPPKVKVKFQLDINGIFSVASVTSIETYEVEVEEEVKVEIPPEEVAAMEVDQGSEVENPATVGDQKSQKSDGSDQQSTKTTDEAAKQSTDQTAKQSTDQTAKQSTDQVKNEEKLKSTGTEKEFSKNDAKDDTKGVQKEEKPKEKPKPKYRMEKVKKMVSKKNRVNLPLKEEFVAKMADSSLEIWRKEEITMLKKDKEIQETNEFIKQLNDMEEWLYEDGIDAEKDAFETRLKNLRITGEPVDRRSNEAKRRPQCIRDFHRGIAEAKALVDSKDKKYEHIPKEDREKGLKKCKETEEWLVRELKKQDPLSLADDPVVLCETIDARRKNTADICTSIMNKPKPKPKKPKVEKEVKTNEEKGDKDNSKNSKNSKNDSEKSDKKEGDKVNDNQIDSNILDTDLDLGCD